MLALCKDEQKVHGTLYTTYALSVSQSIIILKQKYTKTYSVKSKSLSHITTSQPWLPISCIFL